GTAMIKRKRRTCLWPKADTPKNAIDVAIGGKADMPFLHCTCPLLTQSGHGAVSYRTFFNPLRCLVPSLGGGHETARVHHASLRRGSVAAPPACAAGSARAAHRRAN